MRASSVMFVTGIALILAGVLALVNPLAASVAVTTVTGVALMVAGGVAALALLIDGRLRGRTWNLVAALLAGLAGFWLLIDPLSGTVSLTIIVGAMILVIGVIRLLMVPALRGTPFFVPVLASGLASAGIGLAVLFGIAALETTLLGVLLGIALISEGLGMAAIGGRGRRAGV